MISHNNPIKMRWMGFFLVIFSIIGIAVFSKFLVLNDQKTRHQDILDKGHYITSLVALHPLKEFNSDRRDFFLRTLTEYISSEGLVYCMIHDQNGKELLSLSPHGLTSKIPEHIQTKALYTMGLMKQSFQINGFNAPIYEFAKPIFEGGNRSGTVRLGFKSPKISWISLERISLLAIIAFFIMATGTFVYYGTASVLRPLKTLYQSLGILNGEPGKTKVHSGKGAGIIEVISDLEQSFLSLRNTLRKAEIDNTEMVTRLGVTAFERKQIGKIIDSLNFGIVITDLQDNISYINDYLLSLFGTEKSEALDHPVFNVLNDDGIRSFISHQDTVTNTIKERQYETELPELAPGKIFLLALSYLKDEDGAVTGKMMTVKDITGQKSAEKVTQDFMANIAHEFLTPLTTIKSYNEMLMDDEIDDKEMKREFYNTISEETTRLTRLIQNLLSISKIQMGAMSLQRGLVKTDWLAGDCITAVETLAAKKNITLNKVFPDNFPSLMGDKELLKTAVINLLGNAVKYSPEGASITFSLYDQEGMVVIEVSDTGYGISEEDLPHIFEKFYRSKDPKIAENTGSGLGLAMTSEIIHLHEGEIDVRSTLGEGTHFTVSIPKEDYRVGKR